MSGKPDDELPAVEYPITIEMMYAGVDALRNHYGEPGESTSFFRRAVEEIYQAMRAAEAADMKKAPPA